MAFWYPTLAIACISLLFTAIAATLIRHYRPASPAHASGLLFLQYARYLLYALSGLSAALQGTYLDGLLSGLLVAALDSSLGWWLSARILKPRLVPIPRAKLLSTHIPLTILTATVTGLLFGGIGAWIGQLWK